MTVLKKLVSLAAVFSIVTQRDDTKNGCEGDYKEAREHHSWLSEILNFKPSIVTGN